MRQTARFNSSFCYSKTKRKKRLSSRKNDYLNITKLLRPGNIVNGAQNPFVSIKFAILSRSSF